MELTPKEKLLIFALGIYLQDLKSRVESVNLDIAIQKSVFIDFVLKTKLFEKKERALYQNLENLEEKKIIAYPNKRIVLTEKGLKEYYKIQHAIMPYLTVYATLQQVNIVKETRKIQTVFNFSENDFTSDNFESEAELEHVIDDEDFDKESGENSDKDKIDIEENDK